jgi:hypothetical protein
MDTGSLIFFDVTRMFPVYVLVSFNVVETVGFFQPMRSATFQVTDSASCKTPASRPTSNVRLRSLAANMDQPSFPVDLGGSGVLASDMCTGRT